MPRHTTGRAMLACLLTYAALQHADAATFTVTSTASGSTSAGCDADCSLHDAIVAANGTTVADTIEFNISGTGVKTIGLDADGLPQITRPVTIDGYTQTGATVNSASTGSNAVLTVALTRSNPDPINDTLISALSFSSTATGSAVRGIAFVQMGATTVSFIATDADNVVIDGNFFGTNAAGDADGGQAPSSAVSVNATANNVTVGGSTAAARNLFAGIEQGISLFGTNAIVRNNIFGLEDNGSTALALNDVAVLTSGDGHEIGGTGASDGNVFANIDSHAVLVSSQSQGNSILGNSFRNNNSGLAINLQAAGDPVNGVTANDGNDPDTGANNLQNFPEILSAIRSGSNTNVTFTLTSTGSRTFRIEFYASDTADPSGFGEGQRFLQSTDVTTNATGFATAIISASGSALPSGDFVTATATDLSTGETSEFSAAVLVGQTVTVNAADDTNDGTCNSTHCSLREAILATNADTAFDRINFAIPGAGPHTIVAGAGGLPDVSAPVNIDGGSQAGSSANTQTGASNDAVRKIVLSAPSVVSLADLLTFAAGSDGSIVSDIAFKDLDSDGGSMLSIESNDVTVSGCSFGVDATGNADGGNSGLSALSVAGDANRIGLTSPGSRLLFGGVSSAMLVSGDDNRFNNFTIGLSAAGTPSVPVTGSASVLVTGFDNSFSALGTSPNRVVGNAGKGIRIAQNRTGNQIVATLFQNNGGIAIDLEASSDPSSGVTPNDPNDADSGANGLQNHPLITLAERNPDGTGSIQGTLSTNPVNGTAYVIELFHSPTAHASGSGEAASRLGTVNVNVNASGVATFSFSPVGLPVGGFISATASRSSAPRDSSEFSPAVALINAPIVVTNTNQSGAGSLAQAILTANSQTGADRIHFAIPGSGPHRIGTGSNGLPSVTDRVTIDGYTQSGAAPSNSGSTFSATIKIEIQSNIDSVVDTTVRFDSGSSASRIRGVALFLGPTADQGTGITIDDATGVQIDGNLIGTDATGATGAGFRTAVAFEVGADFGIVGGTTSENRNQFANNLSDIDTEADDLVVQSNSFGRRLDGQISPTSSGVAITVSGDRALIGGSLAQRNVIFGHSTSIVVEAGGTAELARNLLIQSRVQAIDLLPIGPNSNDPGDTDVGPNGLQNYPVFTSVSSTGASTELRGSLNSLPNTSYRIEVYGATEGTFGNAQTTSLIDDFVVSTDSNGVASFVETITPALSIGDLITASATSLATSPGQTSELAPLERVSGPDFVVTSTNDSNDGTCNTAHCSLREALTGANANADVSRIRFNLAGAGPTFTITPASVLPSITQPLLIDGYSQPGASPNSNVAPPNNAQLKIVLDGSTIAGLGSNPALLNVQARDVEIRGLSLVGLEDGSIGNEAIETPNNVNVITANVLIRGNYIGLLPDGTTVDANHVGISLGGEADDTGNEIGGPLPEHQNIISGNGQHGIVGTAPDVRIENNLIGTGKDGTTARGNVGNGIQWTGALGGLISQNLVAFNNIGIAIGNSARGIAIEANSIHSNLALGVDLAINGPTPNDPLDPDTGANNLTNKPELVLTNSSGQSRSVAVGLPGRSSTSYDISYYAERSCPLDDLLEGELFLETDTHTAGADGVISVSKNLVLPDGFTQISALATDRSTGETSEFSACATVLADAVFGNSFE